jgi:hypothetical protein
VTTGAHGHRADELCESGLDLYARALREGRVTQQEAEPAPCLIDSGLLQPDIEDMRWLRPVAPAVALPRLLRATAEDITRQRQREARLAEAFEPLMALDAGQASSAGAQTNTVLSGFERIQAAIARAMAASSQEVLTVQPGGKRPVPVLAAALLLEQEMLSRGCRTSAPPEST